MASEKQERVDSSPVLDLNGIYHEKQSRELCALHSLNNLFQDKKAFTKKTLDEICLNLSPSNYINPHRNILGLGNYDVNVIMAALQLKDYEAIWFDKRRDIHQLDTEMIYGYILNIPTDVKLGRLHIPIYRKHWITIRHVGKNYYNLDSKLDCPEFIGGIPELLCFLKLQIQSQDKELILVVKQGISTETIWKLPQSDGSFDTGIGNGIHAGDKLANGDCTDNTASTI